MTLNVDNNHKSRRYDWFQGAEITISNEDGCNLCKNEITACQKEERSKHHSTALAFMGWGPALDAHQIATLNSTQDPILANFRH